MKYINLKEVCVKVEYKSFPPKIVKPGRVINISKNKYNNLKNKDLKAIGLSFIKNTDLQKLFKTDQYRGLVEKRLALDKKEKAANKTKKEELEKLKLKNNKTDK